MDSRQRLLESLTKLLARLEGKGLKQPLLQQLERCPDADFHLAGLFLKEHGPAFLEALQRMD